MLIDISQITTIPLPKIFKSNSLKNFLVMQSLIDFFPAEPNKSLMC